jgi:hypothetical protein
MSDYEDYGRNGRSSSALGQSEADVKLAIEQNKNTLNNIDIKTDNDGNAKLFGMKVDKALLPALQLGLDTAKIQILDNSEKLYKAFLVAAASLGIKGQSAKNAAIAADSAVRWGIIGAEQISSSVTASSEYSKKRRDLSAEFRSIMDATNINSGNNEVIGLAYQRAKKHYGDELKWMLTDLPRVVPMALVGAKEQKTAASRYETEFTAHSSHQLESIDGLLAAKEQASKARAEALKKMAAREEAEAFIAEQEIAGKKLDEKARQEIYDTFAVGNNPKITELTEAEKQRADNKFKMLSFAGITGSQLWKSIAGKKREREMEASNIHVPEMVEDLRNEIASQLEGVTQDRYGRAQKTADDIVITGRDGRNLPLKEYIIEMFQQHERDREPATDWTKRDKNGNITQVVDPLGAALVAKLEPAAGAIAEAIASGLDPMAMINLIGGNQVIEHGKKGARTFVSVDKVCESIDELMPVLGAQEHIKLEEYLAKFEKPEEIKNLIKSNLETMKAGERQLFAALMPDDILKQLGVKHNAIKLLRKESHKDIYDFVAANVVYLSAKEDEALTKLGLAEAEIANIKSLAEKIAAGDEHALKTAVDGHDKSVIDAVRTAGLLEQHHGSESKDYWSHRASEMKDVRSKLSDAAKQFDGESDPLKKAGYDRQWDDERPSHAQRVSPRANPLEREASFTARERKRDPDGDFAYER